MAEAVELLEREEAPIRQDGVERQTAMALAQDEAIALAPVRLGRIVAQEVVIEDANDLDQGKRRPDMPSPAILDGPKNQAPEMPATLVQGFKLDRIEIGLVIQQSPILHANSILSESPPYGYLKLALVCALWEWGLREKRLVALRIVQRWDSSLHESPNAGRAPSAVARAADGRAVD